MITCGIDIGKGKHAVAVIDELGHQLVRTRFYDNTRAGAEKLMEELSRHAEPAQIHVGMESTGSYWRAYYDFLSKRGCAVDVINPIVTSASSAGDIRGRKTDKRDAESIAEVVMRGKYVRRRDEGLQERKLRALTRQRGFIVEERSAAKLHLSSMVAEAFAEFESLFEDPTARWRLRSCQSIRRHATWRTPGNRRLRRSCGPTRAAGTSTRRRSA